jgi:hypothetical protein
MSPTELRLNSPALTRFILCVGIFGPLIASLSHAQVPDCAHFKEEELHSPQPLKPVVPRSKLLHFCYPGRIPGVFFVKIKNDEDLAKDISPSDLKRLKILPGLVPNSKAKCVELGQALAEKHRAKLAETYCTDELRTFVVRDISDADAAALAQDPRVEYLEPDMPTTI